MDSHSEKPWEDLVVPPEEVLASIKPGMTIFLGSGVAEPRTLMKSLADSGLSNTIDLELIQLTSHGDLLSLTNLDWQRFHLTTFFSSWVASDAIVAGSVDLIPARISQIPRIIKSRGIPIDVAIVQITPPNEAGYCSLGMAVDIAREAMERASLVVGEINTEVPFTFGDTLVSVSDFDLLVRSTESPIFFKRSPFNKTMDRVAANIAQVIEDGDCISFSIGPLFEALGIHLVHKHHMGIHSSYFTDALMDLVKSGAVTNNRKATFRGKSVASYALGTPELMAWLDHNPLVEFQGIEHVLDPTQIGRNPHFAAVFQAWKVDLLGRVAFPVGKGNITSGPGEAADLFTGAEISRGGRTIFGLPSRNQKGDPNIVIMLRDLRNQFHMRESIDLVVTEYGIANLKWRTIRERAQALIDIAHPDDREELVAQAKERHFLFGDQIFLYGNAQLYPAEIVDEHTFKGGLKVRFRAIRPSDEEAMRRFFYRLSANSIYARFFYRISIMPHGEIQQYVNVSYRRVLSIVALVGKPDGETIIGEARLVKDRRNQYGDLAFIVEEKYHGRGIAGYLYDMMIRAAKKSRLKGLRAQVLQTNKPMMKVFEKGPLPLKTRLEDGVYHLTIGLEAKQPQTGDRNQ
jgi:acyl-CoA hydrolase